LIFYNIKNIGESQEKGLSLPGKVQAIDDIV